MRNRSWETPPSYGTSRRRAAARLALLVSTGALAGAAMTAGHPVTARALVINETPVSLSPFGVSTLSGTTYFTETAATTTDNDAIGKLVNGAAQTVVQLPAQSSPKGIVAGPDGALWFTEQGFSSGNKIGRVTPAGVLTETTIPTAQAGAAGIAVGPDGNLWFTETHVAKIGRLQPCSTGSCTVDEFSLSDPNAAPLFVTAGPAGTSSIWFTERDVSKIGEATIVGAAVNINEFAIPTAGSQPYGVTAGGDGNVWFTEHLGNKVGRVNVTCALTAAPPGCTVIDEFAVPTGASAPAGIAQGPDGSLWFSEQRANKIGHVTTSGSFLAEFAIPTAASQPLNLTATGNRLWFSESAQNKIGFFDVGSGTVGYVLDGYGGLHPYASAGTIDAPTPHVSGYWSGWDIARSVALVPGADSGYVLDGWGGIHPFSTQHAPAPATIVNGTYWQGWDIARDIAVRPDGVSGYVLDGFGGVHPWSAAGVSMPPAVAVSAYWRGWNIARRLVLNPADPSGESGYVLDGWGGLHPFSGPDTLLANAPLPIDSSATGGYWPGWNIARDVVLTANGAGYSLDGWGGVHALGTAPRGTFKNSGVYWRGFDIGRALVVTSDQTGGYVLDGWGGVHAIGTAPALRADLQAGSYWPRWDIAHGVRGVG